MSSVGSEKDRKAERRKPFALALRDEHLAAKLTNGARCRAVENWSDLEFEKCGLIGNLYHLAILLPSRDDYEIAWIWRPAIELANAERFVEWI